jgi:hypothetical protein
MQDEELKLEEIEAPHTLGGYRRCEYYSAVRYTMVNRSRGESAAGRGKVWLRKKPMDLCACESEEREHGVGAGANTTLLSGSSGLFIMNR